MFARRNNFLLKSFYRVKLVIILFLLTGPGALQQGIASHAQGGEITWTCQPGGAFIFQLKFYRDCNGIPGPASIGINTTVAGIPNIWMALYSQTDISYNGFGADGITSCPDCAQGNGGSPIPGLIEEFVYRSAPINLPGIPPANGWVFSWGECCRANTIVNLTGAGGFGFRHRAIMYPYQGMTTQPCFDSSPYFVERPPIMSCAGSEFKYSIFSQDPENDSLVYSWGTPQDEVGNVIPFAPGYNVNSQLPSPTQHPGNVAAVLDPQTGEIRFTSFTTGRFVTVVKVTAYKCGIKVAEIFRDVNHVITTNCDTIPGSFINNPPFTNAPFTDQVTGLQTSFIDTVMAGDTVNFVFMASDTNMFLNGNPQTITIEGYGDQFGAGFTDSLAGCNIPPCATIAGGLPISFLLGGQIIFNWVTTCAHAQGGNPQCLETMTTYTFLLRTRDNFCPVNGISIATIRVTVRAVPITITASGPATLCQGDTIILTASGAPSFTWNTGQTGSTINVTQPGTYFVTGDSAGTCIGNSLPLTITLGSLPNVTAFISEDTLCFNGGPESLSGMPAGGGWTGPGISGTMFTPAMAGLGTHALIYTISDSLGCIGTDTLFVVVNACTGINDISASNHVTVSPNPAYDQITVTLSDHFQTEVTLSLYNVYGQCVRKLFRGIIKDTLWKQTFDIATLDAGIYFLGLPGHRMIPVVHMK